MVHGNDLTRDQRLTFTTLPGLYDELLGGARAELHFLDRWRVALTGYGANNYWHGKPLELDAQEWSHTPFGGPFGAVGVDARGLLGDFTVFVEATRTFDSIPNPTAAVVQAQPLTPNGGGGFGVEQRTVYSHKGNEVEVSLRYYDVRFVNPYARPPSAPDEVDGQRARNEAGLRVRYMGKLPQDLLLLARADFWANPYASATEGPAGTSNLYALARLDLGAARPLQALGVGRRAKPQPRLQPARRLRLGVRAGHAWATTPSTARATSTGWRRRPTSPWSTAGWRARCRATSPGATTRATKTDSARTSWSGAS